jgi:hypothetical protein
VADLSRRGRRGQILLITAFVLAVISVGLALVMNTVIYSENLATRADSTTSQPVLHANTMETGTEGVIRFINDHNTSTTTGYGELRQEISTAFDSATDVSGRHSLRDGQVTDATLGTSFNATWIEQTDRSRNFTDQNLNTDWTLVNGANGTRTMRFFVDTASVTNGPAAFGVVADDSAGSTWRLDIGNDEVSMTDSGGTTVTCSLAPPGWVNVSEGTVGGSDVLAAERRKTLLAETEAEL